MVDDATPHDTPDVDALLRLLDAPDAAPLETARQVFVNRNLPLEQVLTVGFDMDYTLAIYRRLPMEQLQHDLTIDKLVRTKGYPENIRALPYDPIFVIRGLVVDRARGNILKLDAHGGVGRCYHGLDPVGAERVREIYRHVPVRLSNARRFASLDTLFSLPETCLYASLLDYFEERAARGADVGPLAVNDEFRAFLDETLLPAERADPTTASPPLNYVKLFDDMRECIDAAHRDGTLKTIIKQDVGHYIFPDPELPPTLHKLRSSGKKLFLLTNSHWDYTHHVMSFLLEGHLPEYPSWRHFFDVVIVGAGKPRFFTENQPFLEVDTTTQQTRPSPPGSRFERGHVYQGGNIREFEARCGANGDQVLYVGDHIYGDILRSKKNSMWRTVLVVQELEDEIRLLEHKRTQLWELAEWDRKRDVLDARVNLRKAALARLEQENGNGPLHEVPADVRLAVEKTIRRRLDQDKRELRAVAAEVERRELEVANSLNPYWGLVFKEAHELSRLGEWVDDYADLYTSRVSNLLFYSPMHHFRATRNQMHHERAALAGERRSS